MSSEINPVKPAQRFLNLLEEYSIESVPLDEAALSIAEPHCHPFDGAAVLDRMDDMADEVLTSVGDRTDDSTLLDALRKVLFVKYGLHGNEKDYYNPDNSFLNRILETGRGLPITLSLVMIEVGRRVGLRLHGIGLPCHFIVGYRNGRTQRYFDPFCRGVERTEKECAEYVSALTGGSVRVTRRDFNPVSKRLFLTRLLNNLRFTYHHREEYRELHPVLVQLLRLNPADPTLHLEMAATLNELGEIMQAYSYVRSCLRMNPDYLKRGEYVHQVREILGRFAVLN